MEICTGISRHSNSKRHLFDSRVLRESNVDPRPRNMTPSNENDIFHTGDSQAKILSDLETVVDILYQPFTEVAASDRVLTFRREWEG